MLSVIIPSRSDKYLQKTTDDLAAKAGGELEIIVVLDGYQPDNFTPNGKTRVFPLPGYPGMRACINYGMSVARGKYLMKLDEHCMLEQDFDIKLKADCLPSWLVIPRRYRLDADNWQVIDDERPPVDYMTIVNRAGYLHGEIDNTRARERADIQIDDLMTFQGSCYFLYKYYWDNLIRPLDDAHYGPFANEAQEIGNKVWLSGGRVVVNKRTWYAHWHRKGNLYHMSHEEKKKFDESVQRGRAYCADYWLNNKWRRRIYDYEWLVEKFAPERMKA
jgi:hypothetical protein